MEADDRPTREIFAAIMADEDRPRTGFGTRAAMVNVDLMRGYTDVARFSSAYEADPRQLEHINRLSALARDRGMPVVWTRVGFLAGGDDIGVFGARSVGGGGNDEPADRLEFDTRADVRLDVDAVFTKTYPSAFFGTPLASLLTWRGVDTVIVTGGATSSCVRATVTDAVSHGFRTIVPLECVADDNAARHYANLADMALKLADVESVEAVAAWLERQPPVE